jgi:hypothetical protein
MIERGLCYLNQGHWGRRSPIHPEAGLRFFFFFFFEKVSGSEESICKVLLQQ